MRASLSIANAIALLCFTLSGCSGPIETRIQSVKPAEIPAEKFYQFSARPEQDNDAYRMAREMVGKALTIREFKQSPDAPILVEVAVAERPAAIAISVGEKEAEQALANQKEQKFLQSCADREHRLTIAMVDRMTGDILYTGSAAEYHCKGRIDESLPFLVNAALGDLESPADVNPRSYLQIRKGLE